MNSLMGGLLGWLDDRTGYKKSLEEALYENIPGGARWRYVTGSMLVFAFATQAITGIFLWMCYSPGSQNAWESVYYIQNEMQGGWLLRGLHHFMAQAMVVLLPIHMLQVIWDKAYKAPREINFWLGLILMLITLGLSLTGYLLPWDQKGYWATKVATNLMSLAPGGPQLQKLVVGGSDYGHFTLTRFFGLHAGVLPALLVMFLALHIAMFRRHGITAEPSEKRPDQDFWPSQVLKDSLACLALLVVVLLACVHFDVVGVVTGNLPEAHRGAHLSAPADAVEEYKAARPEWYFLFLFQMLKYFEESEFIGAIVIPGVIVGYLFLMPLIGRWQLGHKLNVAVFLLLFAGAGYLTAEALYFDNYESFHKLDEAKLAELDDAAKEQYERPFKAAREYHEAVEAGHHEYMRVKDLVGFYGIPRSGAVVLQRSDPETVGPRLFRRNCASCHSYLNEEGLGISGPEIKEGEANGAPNLYRFAGRSWIEGLLDPDKIISSDYFGATAHVEGSMVSTVNDLGLEEGDLKKIALALSYEAGLVYQAGEDAKIKEDGSLTAGRTLMEDNCADCHKFSFIEAEEDSEFEGPDMDGYGSYQWLREFIANPEHARFYPDTNDRMPAFAADPDNPDKNLLTDREVDLLTRWLRADDYDLMLKLKLEQPTDERQAADAPEEPKNGDDPPNGDASKQEKADPADPKSDEKEKGND